MTPNPTQESPVTDTLPALVGDETAEQTKAVCVQLEALAFRMECRVDGGQLTIGISPGLGRELVTALRSAKDLIAHLTARAETAEEQADKFKWQVRDTCARAEKAEARIKELEDAYEVQTKALGFAQNGRCAAEARAETAEAGLARAVAELKEMTIAFARAQTNDRRRTAYSSAKRFLATHPAPTQEPK